MAASAGQNEQTETELYGENIVEFFFSGRLNDWN